MGKSLDFCGHGGIGGAQEDCMIPLIAVTLFVLVFIVLIGLLGRRMDRQREEEPPAKAPQDRH